MPGPGSINTPFFTRPDTIVGGKRPCCDRTEERVKAIRMSINTMAWETQKLCKEFLKRGRQEQLEKMQGLQSKVRRERERVRSREEEISLL